MGSAIGPIGGCRIMSAGSVAVGTAPSQEASGGSIATSPLQRLGRRRLSRIAARAADQKISHIGKETSWKREMCQPAGHF